MVLWYWSALKAPETGIMWFALLWSVPFVAVGLFLAYATLAGLLNRTVIKVTSEFLTVRHGPVPSWYGNRRLRIDELGGFSCEADADAVKHRRSRVYGVHVRTKGAGKVDLVTNLDGAEALFIKQALERCLNLDGGGAGRDRPR
jgi:hypothetical protein